MNGSRIAHCSSVKMGLAITVPPCVSASANLRFAGLSIFRQIHCPIFHFVRGSYSN
jgi:hypothetical protein